MSRREEGDRDATPSSGAIVSVPASEVVSDPVEQLVAECLLRLEDTGDAAVDQILARNPEHATAIRQRLDVLKGIGLMGASSRAGDRAAPERLGEFRLLRSLGGGGMGVVYLAEQTSLGRLVALKLIRPEYVFFADSRERFRREVEAVARLKHPGIVPIYSVGEEGGIPYFAMEHVEGCTLAQALQALSGRDPATLTGRDLTTVILEVVTRAIVAAGPEAIPAATSARSSGPAPGAACFEGPWEEVALRIARTIAEALEHAHGRGILHRDVKPSNIMLTLTGQVMLLDFGLARSEGSAQLTRTGSQIGSLHYMSPQQVRGEERALDRRTDVYSLGVTLYEMLALASPYFDESSEVSRRKILDARPEPMRKRHRGLSWETETVCQKAMEPDPARRYASAAAFARDLSNVIEHRPVEARRASGALRARRWAQRHPALAVSIVLGFLLCVVGPSVFAWRMALANDEVLAALRHTRGLRLTSASRAAMTSDPGFALLLAVEGAELNEDREARDTLALALNSCYEERTLAGHSGSVHWAEFSPDGRLVATASADGTARIWDAESGRLLHELGHGANVSVTRARFSPDSSFLVTAAADGKARIWNVASGTLVHALTGHTGAIVCAEFDPSGTRVATTSLDRSVRVWNAKDGSESVRLRGHTEECYSVEFSRDGTQLLTSSYDGTVRLWNTSDGSQRWRCLTPREYWKGVRNARFSPDERLVIASSNNRTPCLIDAQTGAILRQLPGHKLEVIHAEFSPDGRWIVTASYDGTARVYDVASGREKHSLEGHLGQIVQATFSPDSRRVLTASADGTARLWDVESGVELAVLRGHKGGTEHCTFSPDGARIVTAGDRTARIWDAATGRRFASLPAHTARVCALVPSRDGRLFATCSDDRTAAVWDAQSGTLVARLLGHEGSVLSAEFSPDDRTLLTASNDRTARIFDVESGEEKCRFTDHEMWLRAAHFSPDASHVVTACGGVMRQWEARSGDLILRSQTYWDEFQFVMFLESGQQLVAVNESINLWDVGGGVEPRAREPMLLQWYCLTASPDHRSIAAGYFDGFVRIHSASDIDSHGSSERAALFHGPEVVQLVAFSPDGSRLISAGSDRRVKVWDVTTGAEIAQLAGISAPILQVAASERAERVVIVSSGAAQVWSSRARAQIATVQRVDADVSCAALSRDGSRVYAGFSDGRVLVWTIYDDPLAEARRRRPRELTVQEKAQFEIGSRAASR